nr:MAG TPA: hypothetical protein [Caudoviricetes sp.]
MRATWANAPLIPSFSRPPLGVVELINRYL